jgi:Fe-S-cluster containining protein
MNMPADNDPCMSLINWELDEAAFRNQVRNMVTQCRKRGKVIGLPIILQPGDGFVDLLSMLLGAIDCSTCGGNCCKNSPHTKTIGILPSEYAALSKKYGKDKFVITGDDVFLPMPCPFMRSTEGKHCSIYSDRPFVCTFFPFQFGGVNGEGQTLLSVASDCPEARRLSVNVFMANWQLRTKFKDIGATDFLSTLLKEDVANDRPA